MPCAIIHRSRKTAVSCAKMRLAKVGMADTHVFQIRRCCQIHQDWGAGATQQNQCSGCVTILARVCVEGEKLYTTHERWVDAVEDSRTCVTWLMSPSEGVPTRSHGSRSVASSLLLRGPSAPAFARSSPPSCLPEGLTLPICPRKRGVEALSVGRWRVLGDFSVIGDSGRSCSSFGDLTTPIPPCAGISPRSCGRNHVAL